MPTSCVSAQGGTPKVTIDLWQPPYKFRIGTRSTVEHKGNPTKRYTFSSRRVGAAIQGELELSYSRLTPDGWGGYRIMACFGTASYTAKAR